MTGDRDPGATAPGARLHRLADGTRVQVRPLVASDRAELAERYGELSERSQRLRFVSAPAHLNERVLDYLMDVDQVDRHALVATLIDEPDTPSIGVARYYRSRSDPTVADAAVTVLDAYQQRGVGTLLLMSLVADAMANGIDEFTADVLWENRELLAGLRAVGARVVPGEPGLASVHVDLPPDPKAVKDTTAYDVLRIAGADSSAT